MMGQRPDGIICTIGISKAASTALPASVPAKKSCGHCGVKDDLLKKICGFDLRGKTVSRI